MRKLISDSINDQFEYAAVSIITWMFATFILKTLDLSTSETLILLILSSILTICTVLILYNDLQMKIASMSIELIDEHLITLSKLMHASVSDFTEEQIIVYNEACKEIEMNGCVWSSGHVLSTYKQYKENKNKVEKLKRMSEKIFEQA